jgi:hypothetical protein
MVHMPNAIEASNRENKRPPGWSILLSMAIVGAANTAWICTLVGMMSWQERVALIFTAGTLTGGVFFTVWTMRGLGK